MTTHIPPAHLGLGVLELGLVVLGRSRWWAPRATSAQVPLLQVQVLEQGIRAGEKSLAGEVSFYAFNDNPHSPPLTHYIAMQSIKSAQYFCQVQNTQLGFVGLL